MAPRDPNKTMNVKRAINTGEYAKISPSAQFAAQSYLEYQKVIETANQKILDYKSTLQGKLNEHLGVTIPTTIKNLTNDMQKIEDEIKKVLGPIEIKAAWEEQQKVQSAAITKIIKDMREELKYTDSLAKVMQKLGIEYDITAAKASIFLSAIQDLTKQGLSAQSNEVQNVIKQYQALRKSITESPLVKADISNLKQPHFGDKLAGAPKQSLPLDFMKNFQSELDLIALKNKTLGESFNTTRDKLSLFKGTLNKMWDEGLRPGMPLMDMMIKKMKELSAQQEVADILQNSFTDFFTNVTDNFNNFGDFIKSWITSILKSFQQMAAAMIAQKIVAAIMPEKKPKDTAATAAIEIAGVVAKTAAMTASIPVTTAATAAATQLAVAEAAAAAAWVPLPGTVAAVAGNIAAIIATMTAGQATATAIGVVPGLAKGGIVPQGYPNDTFPALLSSGETVIPPYKAPTGNDKFASEIVSLLTKLVDTTKLNNKELANISPINDPVLKSVKDNEQYSADIQKYKDIALLKSGSIMPREQYVPIKNSASFTLKDIENGVPGIRNNAQVNKEVLAAISKAAAQKNISLMTALETSMRESGIGSHLNMVNKMGKYLPSEIMGNASELGMPDTFDQFLLKKNVVDQKDVVKGSHGLSVGGGTKYFKHLDEYDKYLSSYKDPYAGSIPFTREMDVLKNIGSANYNPMEKDRISKITKDRMVIKNNPALYNFADSVYNANLNTVNNGENMMQIGTSLTNGPASLDDYSKALQNVIDSTKTATDVTNVAAKTTDKTKGILSGLIPALLGGVINGGIGSKKQGKKGLFSSIFSTIFPSLLSGILNIALPGAGTAIKGISDGAARNTVIPGLAKGGVIPQGYPNDTYPALLSSGEKVIPPGKLDKNMMQPMYEFEDVRFVIEENQLVGVLKKANTRKSIY
jgi:hypothetical protein